MYRTYLILISLCSWALQPTFSQEIDFFISEDGSWSQSAEYQSFVQNKRLYTTYLNSAGDLQLSVVDLIEGSPSGNAVSLFSGLNPAQSPRISLDVNQGFLQARLVRKRLDKEIVSIKANRSLPLQARDWEASQTEKFPLEIADARWFSLQTEVNKQYLFYRNAEQDIFWASLDQNGNIIQSPTLLIKNPKTGEKFQFHAVSKGTDRIDFFFTDADPLSSSSNLYHLYYHNNFLYQSDGSQLKGMNSIPIALNSVDKVFAYGIQHPSESPFIESGQYHSSRGPSVIYSLPHSLLGSSYVYCEWDTSINGWKHLSLTESGGKLSRQESYNSAGIQINPYYTNEFILSAKINPATGAQTSFFELYKGILVDSSQVVNWIPLTSSSSEDNFRPHIPLGADSLHQTLIWLKGYFIDDQRTKSQVVGKFMKKTLVPECGPILFHQANIIRFDTSKQDRGIATVSEGGTVLRVANNAWKAVAIRYTLSPNTVIEFDFKSPQKGEGHAFGFDNDLTLTNGQRFKLYGTQDMSLWAFLDYENYPGDGAYKHYKIPVGQFMTGSYDYMYFTADMDTMPRNAVSYFRNVTLYEDNEQAAGLNDCSCLPMAFMDSSFTSFDQDQGEIEVLDKGNSISLSDNAWKALPIPYSITPFTILEFEFKSDGEAGEHSIGFEEGLILSPKQRFQLWGTTTGNKTIRDFTYTGDGVYQPFRIPVGHFFEKDIEYLIFSAVNGSSNQTAQSFFRNVRLYEDEQNAGSCEGLQNPCEPFLFADHGVKPADWDRDSGNYAYHNNGLELVIENDAWKAVTFPYTLTPFSVLEFDFKSDTMGAEHSIGFGIDEGRRFKLFGTEGQEAIQDFATYVEGSGIQHFNIPIGQYFNGEISRLVFTALNMNGSSGANSHFSNLSLYEDPDQNGSCEFIPPQPAYPPAEVEQLVFDARPDYGMVRLNWRVDKEKGIARYQLQRSFDGNLFMPFAQVPSLGNTLQPRTYKDEDKKYFKGRSYYRVVAIGFDGTQVVSNMVEINFFGLSPTLLVYPNPLSQGQTLKLEFHLPTEDFVYMDVLTPLGQYVHRSSGSVTRLGKILPIDLNGIAPGMYLLRVRSNSFQLSRMIEIQ